MPLCDNLSDGILWLIVGTFLYGVKALGDRNAKQYGWSKWDVTHLRNTVMARIAWRHMYSQTSIQMKNVHSQHASPKVRTLVEGDAEIGLAGYWLPQRIGPAMQGATRALDRGQALERSRSGLGTPGS